MKSVQIQDWDEYWKKDKKGIKVLYDAIACFYRFFIIKGALNYFIRKYFPPASVLLHAGCGSGQVDVDISRQYRLYALDISFIALKIYRKYNPDVAHLFRADILHLPFKDNGMDGVYNLGVMEHFTPHEIRQILSEFHRVLKPGGKIVIFWPPDFSLSTRFLAAAHGVLRALAVKTELHPAEVTRVKSREHMVGMFEQAGFGVKEYYFGIKDLWTQCVMVAGKAGSF